MKILFVIDSLLFGGAERQFVELIKGLWEQRHGYEIHVVCLDKVIDGYTDILTARGIVIHYFCRAYRYDIRPVFSIYQYINENQIDIVHAFLNLGVLFGLIAAKLAGKPVVCSAIRDAKDHDFMQKIEKRIAACFADIFVANSKAGFTNRFRRLRPHFRVVYNGADFSRFDDIEDKRTILKNELGLSDFQNIIGMVASLTERKDHETLLNAAPKVLKVFPQTCFLFVGDGPKREELTERVRQLGLHHNVLFLGFRGDVDKIYQIFDIFVLLTNSDVHLEGISNAIMEAMALGVPVVASEGGGTNEIVKNNINGVLVPPKNPTKTAKAIVSLISNKDKAKHFSSTAKKFVREKFNLQEYVEKYENIYRELITQER